MKFYEFSQNNSGGKFAVDSQLCRLLIIEASSEEEAISKAEDLGCYWDGVEKDMDCPCCGDRWYRSGNVIDLDIINEKWKGWEVKKFIEKGQDVKKRIDALKNKYKDFEWIEEPKIKTSYDWKYATGRLKLKSIEEYAQLMANEFGFTNPDCRIFYNDGSVKEIFSSVV